MYQYDAPCHVKSCSVIARGEDSFCNICRRDFCRRHFDQRTHWCRYQGRPEWFQEPAQTLADLDIEKLRKEVAVLKPGINFTLDKQLGDVSDRDDDDGGINIHVPLRFEGGEEWLLRLPSFGDKPEPADMVFQIRTSEVLTYKVLRDVGVAVPEVYGWGFGTVSRTSDPCFSHVLYEKMPGSPAHDLKAFTPEQLDRFIETYAEQAIKLSAVKFAAVGGLCLDNTGAITVGKSVDIRDCNAPDCNDLGGPFKSTRDRYLYRVEAILSGIRAGNRFRRAPLRAYLSHLEVKDLVLACTALKEDEQEFYLKHPDGRSDNILVTQSGAVSALLDWEWANTTCKTAAFGAPLWAYPNGFWYGNMKLSKMELKLIAAYEKHGREDLAQCVKNARVHQLLDGFLGVDLPFGELASFIPTLQALRFTLDPGSTHVATSIEEWLVSAEMKYQKDDGLEHVRNLDRTWYMVRSRSEIVYPLRRAAFRIWRWLGGWTGKNAV